MLFFFISFFRSFVLPLYFVFRFFFFVFVLLNFFLCSCGSYFLISVLFSCSFFVLFVL